MKCIMVNLSILLFPLFSVAQVKMKFDNPPARPEMLPEGINTSASERDFALSPDGNEIYFTLQAPRGVYQTIVFSKKQTNGSWSKPVVASFAGHYTDLEPAFSVDGSKLYFCSNRPIKGSEPKDFDIWMVERTPNGWGKAINLGPVINTVADEFYPSVAASGNLYFTATYNHGVGKEDIFLSKYENGNYLKPVPLDSAINSKTYEFNACVSPDEKYLLFTSYGRKDDAGGGDLYISRKSEAGVWQPSINIRMINSNKLDYCPFISPDGKALFFTSEKNAIQSIYRDVPANYEQLLSQLTGLENGGGNIYWVRFDEILKTLK